MNDFELLVDVVTQCGCYQCGYHLPHFRFNRLLETYTFSCPICGLEAGKIPVSPSGENELTGKDLVALKEGGLLQTEEYYLRGEGVINITLRRQKRGVYYPLHKVMTDEEIIAEFDRLVDHRPINKRQSFAARWDYENCKAVLVNGKPNPSDSWFYNAGVISHYIPEVEIGEIEEDDKDIPF